MRAHVSPHTRHEPLPPLLQVPLGLVLGMDKAVLEDVEAEVSAGAWSCYLDLGLLHTASRARDGRAGGSQGCSACEM